MSLLNKSLIIVKEPDGLPKYGEDLKLIESTIDVDSISLQGGILVKTITISLDPTLRNSMRLSNTKSYSKTYKANQVIWGFGIAQVIRSEREEWEKGDLVYSRETRMANYSIITGKELDAGKGASSPALDIFSKVNRLPELNITNYVSAAGMPGMTAWMSLKAIIGDFKQNSTIFVTSAAGAVGSLVCQLAQDSGVRVIASAGSEEKIKFLQEQVKVDRAFNYKTADIDAELASFGGEKGIDYFFDNVGGKQLESYLAHSALYGTVIVCGSISAYNATASNPAPTIQGFPMSVLTRQLTVRGFIVSTFMPEYYEAFHREMPKLISQGKIRFREDLREGVETLGPSMIDLLQGNHNGKVVVLVDIENKDKWIVAPTDTFRTV